MSASVPSTTAHSLAGLCSPKGGLCSVVGTPTFFALHSFEPHLMIHTPPFALSLPEGGAGELRLGAGLATIREEATMVVVADKQKGRSSSSTMDTGELGERPVHDADGELLVQEL
jgi:hypothetical protein